MALLGQGATEYLVLLAVVLVIALVGVALLGFFPGTASDAQEQESKIYWQSAGPISITEWSARGRTSNSNHTYLYLRVRNSGAYPVRLTKMLNGAEEMPSVTNSTAVSSISSVYSLAPGEEAYFGHPAVFPGIPIERNFVLTTGEPEAAYYLGRVATACGTSPSSGGFGYLVVNNFGFEYVQYVEGQTVTKREIGAKPLVVKCSQPY